jgi:hypothetical protein
MSQFPDSRKSAAFEYTIVIKPLPRIGDTTDITYHLKANENIPNGCDVIIDIGSMEIVGEPKKLDYPINKGQTIEYSIKAVPKSVRDKQAISLYFGCRLADNSRRSQSIPVYLIFSSDGLVRYVINEGFGLACEAGLAGFLLTKMRREELEGNFPVQLSILCQIHLTHATGADLLDDFVVTDSRPFG